MLAIVIAGPPCSGKSHVLDVLEQEFPYPSVTKDFLKEMMFDVLGLEGREWSKKLGRLSYDLMLAFTERLLKTQSPFFLESNFPPSFSKILGDLFAQRAYRSLVINCIADKDVLFRRFERRSMSNERHPGHMDASNLEEFRSYFAKGDFPLIDVGGVTVSLDTTDPSTIDYGALVSKIRSLIPTGGKM